MISNFLSNSWFIGIGGGIFSGLVVTLISRRIFSRKDNKEYHQKIVTANQEILYSIRPGISEGHIPSEQVLLSIIFATAKKYKVEPWDLNYIEDIADSLIKEVMDSSFISISSKKEYCEKLITLKETVSEVKEEEVEPTAQKISTNTNYEYRQKMFTQMSVMLGLTTTLMTIIFFLINAQKSISFSFGEKVFPILMIMVVGIIVPIFMYMIMSIIKLQVKKSEKSKEDKAQSYPSDQPEENQ